ncbi:hypothetical protein [Chthonobacter rhizosphaerae]|uniref:hypothetical protein n=1 Tax=Chthonobacter rhizosphaerae TaxID=2735553 RepID=UPI0015EEE0E8|nr:hypothetical protein [Chthonobacter rhizosphaerae]
METTLAKRMPIALVAFALMAPAPLGDALAFNMNVPKSVVAGLGKPRVPMPQDGAGRTCVPDHPTGTLPGPVLPPGRTAAKVERPIVLLSI